MWGERSFGRGWVGGWGGGVAILRESLVAQNPVTSNSENLSFGGSVHIACVNLSLRNVAKFDRWW